MTFFEQLVKTSKHTATIKSIGSSTRLAGSKLSDNEIEKLLARINTQPFHSRDEHNKSMYLSLPKLSTLILQYIKTHERATITEIVESTNAPRNTIKKYLVSLVAQGYLKQHGQGRGPWYTLA